MKVSEAFMLEFDQKLADYFEDHFPNTDVTAVTTDLVNGINDVLDDAMQRHDYVFVPQSDMHLLLDHYILGDVSDMEELDAATEYIMELVSWN